MQRFCRRFYTLAFHQLTMAPVLEWLCMRLGRRAMYNDIYGDGKENKSNPTESSTNKDGNGNGNDRSSIYDSVEKARQNNELEAATLIAAVTFAAGLKELKHLSVEGLKESSLSWICLVPALVIRQSSRIKPGLLLLLDLFLQAWFYK
ncbi:hypothetical protein Q3G72_021164 [Acer saccharum]|nr:hypothetical protein Q3G72_021164 [Acer saccharum]